MSQGVEIKSRTKLMYHRTGMLHGPWLDKASVLIYVNEVDHFPAAGVDTVLLIISSISTDSILQGILPFKVVSIAVL